MHESGQRRLFFFLLKELQVFYLLPELNQLTGIAAILTFPLDVEVVEAEEREEEERKREAADNAGTQEKNNQGG
jgi:hypothetical protein